MNPTLDIIFRDTHLIAINKPSGLLVHPSLVDRHEKQSAMTLLRDMIGQYVYPVHRLDKPTSGVLLFALSSEIARELSLQFNDSQVRKRYLAVVRGYTDESGRIDYPLREKLDKMTDARARKDKPAQSAVTDYHRLATLELPIPVDRYPTSRYSLVEISPQTGRKHQIRRHFKHISHPIIGDTSYGKSIHNRLIAEQFNCRRLLLAATHLTIQHPISGQSLVLEAPIDQTFKKIEALFDPL
ncbi:MAG: tRNA pseudouridine(65) synthase TruC [Candidatus Thiodiazotropha sp. (ex Monitilora ramsayi)]|nr:tRNA pseudouridine(65) synthase TruC [Candidatus Thiodiazotropha sp. (ex Monitilora ramsayi)]